MLNKLNKNHAYVFEKTTSSPPTENDHASNPPIMIGSTEINCVSKIN